LTPCFFDDLLDQNFTDLRSLPKEWLKIGLDISDVFGGKQVEVIDNLLLGLGNFIEIHVFFLHHTGKVLACFTFDFVLDIFSFHSLISTQVNHQTSWLLLTEVSFS
jgi:hypothetical protein